MSQTKPHPKRPPPRPTKSDSEYFPRVFPRGDTRSAKIIQCFDPPFKMAKIRGEGGVICGLIELINGLIEIRPIQTEDGQ